MFAALRRATLPRTTSLYSNHLQLYPLRPSLAISRVDSLKVRAHLPCQWLSLPHASRERSYSSSKGAAPPSATGWKVVLVATTLIGATWYFVSRDNRIAVALKKGYKHYYDEVDTYLRRRSWYMESYLPAKERAITLLFSRAQRDILWNAKFQSTTGLERFADFCLTPHRYLFNGKLMIPSGKEVEFQPLYTSKDRKALKTFAAYISLIPGDVIGYLIKKVAHSTSEEMQRRYERAHATMASTNVEPVNYAALGIPVVISQEPAPCQNLDYGRFSYEKLVGWQPSLVTNASVNALKEGREFSLTFRQNEEVKALRAISAILRSRNIPFWVDTGTCIGAYRNQRMVPWDMDVDLAIPRHEFKNALRALRALDPSFEARDDSPEGHPESYLTIYVRSTGTAVDINVYDIDPSKRLVTYYNPHEDCDAPEWFKATDRMHVIPLAYEVMFPLRPTQFEGVDVYAPNQIENFLIVNYTKPGSKHGVEALDPPYIWNPMTNKWEQVKDHAFWKVCPVETILATK